MVINLDSLAPYEEMLGRSGLKGGAVGVVE